MKTRKTIWFVVSLFVVFSMALAACQPAATSTPAEPAAATSAPTTAPTEVQAQAATKAPEPTATAEPTKVPEPAQVEKVRIAIAKDESSANPYTYVTGYPGWYMMMLQYDTLYQVNAKGEPSPWLATEVKAVLLTA